MGELFLGYYAYVGVVLLMALGLAGMLFKENLMKKVIAMAVFQNAIILFFIVSAYKSGGTIPIGMTPGPIDNADAYINPLPHTMMLTAIVVGVAILGVAFALLAVIHRRYGTLEEKELHEKMR